MSVEGGVIRYQPGEAFLCHACASIVGPDHQCANECQWVGLSPDSETTCTNEADAGRYCTRHAAVARSYDFEQAIANCRRHR